MSAVGITEQEFAHFQRFIFEAAGISLSTAKQALVSGRLGKRLEHLSLGSFGEYFSLLASGRAPGEVQTAVDLLTTNETYFFRELRHFEHLRREAVAARGRGQAYRVWSAASSSGEEAYSIAMVLADCLEGGAWEVTGTDISTRVIERARTAHYPLSRTTQIPPPYLKRFCLKGQGAQEGTLLVERGLRKRVSFVHANLNAPLPQIGMFDVVFLRNVLIYFNADTKRQVVARVLAQLKPGGSFCIGHSETLNGISDAMVAVAPSIYRKP